MTDIEQQIRMLHAPFDPCELEWRFQKTGKQGNGGVMLPYVSARAIMDRLDQVIGAGNWNDSLRVHGEGERRTWVCTLSVELADGKAVVHEDVADETHVEPAKGGASDALKRCAVKLGIGRYLYYLPKFYVEDQPRPSHKWTEHIAQHLPRKCPWAVPGGSGRPPEGKGSSGWNFDTSFSAGVGEAPSDEPTMAAPKPAPAAQPAPKPQPPKSVPERKPAPPAQSSGPADADDPDVPLPTHSAAPFDLGTKIRFGKYKDQTWGWVAMGSPNGRRRGWLRWSAENRATFDRDSMKEQAYMAEQILQWLEGKTTPAEDPWSDDKVQREDEGSEGFPWEG